MREVTLEHYARLRSQRAYGAKISKQRRKMWRHNGNLRRLAHILEMLNG